MIIKTFSNQSKSCFFFLNIHRDFVYLVIIQIGVHLLRNLSILNSSNVLMNN